jgi:hypothetical protein
MERDIMTATGRLIILLQRTFKLSTQCKAVQKTKRLILAGFVICSILLGSCACSSQEKTTAPKGISLSDAPQVLDITAVLPPNFEHLDAAKEGYSHKDLGLSNSASEVELYASREPYGIIYTYFAIYEKRTQQIDMDALLKDDEQAKYFVKENLKAFAGKEDVKIGAPIVTHPAVGDLAVLMEASITSLGTKYNLDLLTFKFDILYVFIYYTYFGSDRLSLISIAHEIEQNITKQTKLFKTEVDGSIKGGFERGSDC